MCKNTANAVQLSAECLEKFAATVQSALTLLYGCGVGLDADKEFGTVAGDLERIKSVAADRAKKIRTAEMEASKPQTCPRCQRLPVKADGLCASCLTVATPAAASKPADTTKTVSKPAPVAAQTAKVDVPKVETLAPKADDKPKVAPKAETAKVAPQGKVALPTSYKALTSLGGEGVRALAKQLGVKADGLGFGVLCGKVWAKVKDAKTPTQAKVEAAPETAKADATPKVAAYAAGTILVADGNGGVRLATESDLWLGLEQMSKAA